MSYHGSFVCAIPLRAASRDDEEPVESGVNRAALVPELGRCAHLRIEIHLSIDLVKWRLNEDRPVLGARAQAPRKISSVLLLIGPVPGYNITMAACANGLAPARAAPIPSDPLAPRSARWCCCAHRRIGGPGPLAHILAEEGSV